MTEQYIYSRSEREYTNAYDQTVLLGFGFVALSPGMDKTLKRDVAAHCEDCPQIFLNEGEGPGLPLLRKVRLPKGRVLLQKSTWIEKSSRDFHVAHGYVLEDGEVQSASPDQWLTLTFQLGDPNEVESGILLDSLSALPNQKFPPTHHLKDAALGLNQEQFCQLLLACFDALVSRRQILIAWDFERPEERQLRLSALYWLYTCLPYDLRVGLGFDSVFTEKSSLGQVHLAFVEKGAVELDGETASIRLGNRQLPLGGNFLVLDGTILHSDNKYKTECYGKDGSYARWLKRITGILWDTPVEKGESAIRALDNLHQKLQRQLKFVPEEKRMESSAYNSACTSVCDLRELEAACGLGKSKEEEIQRPSVPVKEHKPDDSEVYCRIFQHRTQQISTADIQNLSNMCGGRLEAGATALLGAFMAREANMPEKSLTGDVLCRYQPLLPPHVFTQLVNRLFWAGLSDLEQSIWMNCGVESSSSAAEQRRLKWCREIVEAYKPAEDMMVYIKRSLDGLPGLSAEQCGSLKEGLLFQNILSRYKKTLAYTEDDIRFLSAMCSRWTGNDALGLLGVFMARRADDPWRSLEEVLSNYQQQLPLELHTRLLRSLLWDEMSDSERDIWAECNARNGIEAAKYRRKKLYREILWKYACKPMGDMTAHINHCLAAFPGFDPEHYIRMAAECKREPVPQVPQVSPSWFPINSSSGT